MKNNEENFFSPTIYVGLGGTGMKAISKTKQLFESMYGKNKIPENIAFLGIDFDVNSPKESNLPVKMVDHFLSLGDVGNPKTLYNVQKKDSSRYPWMFEQNERFIVDKVADGARQVRTTGRFLIEMIMERIEAEIEVCKARVTSITHYNPDGRNTVDIHMAMSLSGGSGCGSFLNVALMLKDKYRDQIRLIGYGVLDGVFMAMDPERKQTPRVVANAYSAILDLDYLMTAHKHPIDLKINGNLQRIDYAPFNMFYVIDNVTENGAQVNHINDLSEVIGTALYVSGGPFGRALDSIINNIPWTDSNYDVSPKLGWAYSLGACQVVYKGDLLADIYTLKAATNLIQNLQNKSEDDWNQEAVEWSRLNNIKEDEEDDLLIDSFFNMSQQKIKKLALDCDDTIAEIKSDVDKYIVKLPDEYKTDKALKELKDSKLIALTDKVHKILTGKNGVGNALEFLSNLKTNIVEYQREMLEEQEDNQKLVNDKMIALPKLYKDYEVLCKKIKIFGKNAAKQNMLDTEIAPMAKTILKFNIEIQRRKDALTVYYELMNEINNMTDHVEQLNSKLSDLKQTYQTEISGKQANSKSSLIFEYDLSTKERTRIKFEPTNNFIGDYFGFLKKSLYEVDLLDELDKSLKTYCSNLEKAKEYREKLIVDAIDQLNEEEYNKLKREIENKSSRLMRFDSRGLMDSRGKMPTSKMNSCYYYSTYQRLSVVTDDDGRRDFVKTRLEEDPYFLKDVKAKSALPSQSDAMKQKMIFFRADGAIIPYCIGSFSENKIEKEYWTQIKEAKDVNSTTFHPHFDKLMYDDMLKQDFQLKPQMQDEALFYWVCGNIFGWNQTIETQYIMEKDKNGEPVKISSKEDTEHTKYIRYYRGKYQYWKQDDKSNDGEWLPLGNTAQREKAFHAFKMDVFPEIRTILHAKINEELNTSKGHGKGYYKGIVEEIIEAGVKDYIDKVICTDKNSITYFQKRNGEYDLIKTEWTYITRNLVATLENFN